MYDKKWLATPEERRNLKKPKEISYNEDLAPNLEKKVLIIHVLTISWIFPDKRRYLCKLLTKCLKLLKVRAESADSVKKIYLTLMNKGQISSNLKMKQYI